MVDFPKIRQGRIRFRRLFDRADARQTPPNDFRLIFRRSPHEEYTYEEGRIFINGMDVLSLIEGEKPDIELLVNLTGAIDEYRRYVWANHGTRLRDFNALTQGILEKSMNKLSFAYEEMTGGIRVAYNNGRLWINDIDPKVVLSLFLSHPTLERRQYLKSIQTKLALILEGRAGNGHSHGILAEAKRLFVQISRAFENTPAANPPPLLAAAYDMGSS